MQQQDLVELPAELNRDFKAICSTAFTQDPYGCFGLPSHDLRGDLKNYRALELDYEGVCYRIVYRVYELPTPKRVQIISFAEHDLAYARAKLRTNKPT